MDRILIEAGAIPPAVAAEPNAAPAAAPPAASPAGVPPVPSGTEPTTAVSSAPPQPAGPTPEQIAEWQRMEREHKQLVNEIRSFGAQAAQERAMQERQSNRQKVLQTVKQTAVNLPADEAIDYAVNQLNQYMETEVSAERAEANRLLVEQQARAAMAMAPLYAADLGKQHNLRPEYVARLSKMHPLLIDQYLPAVIDEQRQAIEWENRLAQVASQNTQAQRTQAAQQNQETGIHQPSGVGGTPSAGAPVSTTKGTPEHLMSIPGMASLFGYRQAAQE